MNIIISHRGNLYGPDPATENQPSTIKTALRKGFDVEIDLWAIEGLLLLGHEYPRYLIDHEFLVRPGLWIHCKNREAFDYMSNTDMNYFWHTKEDYIFTSKGYIWTHTSLAPLKQSICVLPENLSENLIEKYNIRNCTGICTDYPIRFKDLYQEKKKMSLFRKTVDTNKYFIATYDLACSTNLRDGAWDLAVGQSVGNPNVRNEWETDELFENHSCKILGDEKEMTQQTAGIVKIAFPVANTDWKGDGISQLLVQVMGGQLDIDRITRCRLKKLEFPSTITSYFKGPKFGMTGVRKFTGVSKDKPLLGAIVKPKIGISPKLLLKIVKELVEGGVNFIKEDEIMANPSFCPIEERVPLVMDYLKDKNVIYAVCINGDAPHALERVKRVYELGGNAIHINFWCGLGIYKSIRELDLPLFVHFQKSGDKILTDNTHRFGIDWSVICHLAGMSGVDTIHAGMIGGYSNNSEEEMKEVIGILHSYNVVPALSCGMHPGLVKYVERKIGTGFMANCGGCIHGHPQGTKAGATAMKQAIEGNTDGKEYKEAIKKWELKE